MTAQQLPDNVLESLVAAITELRQELAAKTITAKREWYPASEAYELLGYSSYDQLWEAISSGLLRVGPKKEVSDRRKPGAQRPVYFCHIGRCLKRLEQTPGEREP